MDQRPFDESGFRELIEYYDKTRFDYNIAWVGRDNLAVHFGFYDEHADRHAEALSNTNRVLAKLAAIQPGEKVLDAGCGKGGSCLWLARYRQCTTVGITPVASQVAEARLHAIQAGLDGKAAFIQADYCDAPFESGSFDVVWACESLCHSEHKEAFYREAYRLLRPGGRLALAEYTRQKRPLAPSGEKLLLSWLNRWAIPDINTAAEHRKQAYEAGFREINLMDYTRYTWASLKNLNKIALRWSWANHLLYGMGVRSRTQYRNVIGSIRQFQALEEGLWYYAVLTAVKPI